MFAYALVIESSVADMIENGAGQRAGLLTSFQTTDLLRQSLDGLAEFCSDILEENRGDDFGKVDAARALSRLRLEEQFNRLSGMPPSDTATSDRDELW